MKHKLYKKARKTCIWRLDAKNKIWVSGCEGVFCSNYNDDVGDPDRLIFCSKCGGKIKDKYQKGFSYLNK